MAATQRRNLTGNQRAEPQGPLGHLIQDAIDRKRLGRPRTAKLLNAAIKQETGQAAGITHSSIRNWISRWVIPRTDTQRAIIAVLDIPERTLAEAIEAQEAARAELRMQRSSQLHDPAWTQDVSLVTASTTPEQVVLSGEGLVSSVGAEGSFSDEEFINIPIRTANGVIAYVITRRAFVATLATALPAMALADNSGRPESRNQAVASLADHDFIERTQGSVQHLVLLDNQVGPDQIAGVAAQLFRSVARRLRFGLYRPSIEADLMATAAEVGELAGWLLYDANRHDEAGKVNEAALYWATLAKDQGMADFILTNAGLQAIHLRRTGEAMQVTGRLLDGEDKMSPRVRALARVRRGRARAIAGDATGAARDFEAARSLYLDGVRSNDPSWAWWVDELLITGHGALCRHESGDLKGAVDLFHRAIELCPEHRPRDRFMWHVHLLGTLAELKEWDHAGEVAERAAPFVGDVACGRVVAVLRDSIRRIDRAEGVPLPVRDGIRHLDRMLVEVGYPATI